MGKVGELAVTLLFVKYLKLKTLDIHNVLKVPKILKIFRCFLIAYEVKVS